MIEKKRGQKLCEQCGTPNGVRAYECKNCDYPFKMKKYRKGSKKKRVDDFTKLQKGDEIRVVGGSGPYYTNEDGEKLYLTDRGKYIVNKTGDTFYSNELIKFLSKKDLAISPVPDATSIR